MPCFYKECRFRSVSALFVIKYVNLYQQLRSNNLIGLKFEVGVASYFIQHGSRVNINRIPVSATLILLQILHCCSDIEINCRIRKKNADISCQVTCVVTELFITGFILALYERNACILIQSMP